MGKKKEALHSQKGLLDQHIVRPLNETFLHRDAMTSCPVPPGNIVG